RLQHLQSEIDRLKQAQDVDAISTGAQAPSTLPPDISTQSTASSGSAYETASDSNMNDPKEDLLRTSLGTHSERWLQLPDTTASATYSIAQLVFTSSDITRLFRSFEMLYYPHFCILHTVTSLTKLHEDSELLFWTIVVIASRYHQFFSDRYPPLLAAHHALLAKTTSEAIQSVGDLQAILMTCTWPAEVHNQPRDPSWTRLGLAINAARQMGLDKEIDEIFFGQRRSHHQLGKHPHHIRRLTWLKCFELDVELSCWNGLLPTLACPLGLQTIASFNSINTAPCTYVAIIEIHRQTAMYLSALGDGLAGTLSPTLVRQHHRALTNVKITHAQGWTVNAEIALQASQVYFFALCLVKTESQPDAASDADMARTVPVFLQEMLAGARSTAVQLIRLLTSLSGERNSVSLGQLIDSHPLPGTPKATSRTTFFAGVVLLKYLETTEDSSDQEDADTARAAFSSVHRLFTCCPASVEHMSASRTLECAGRAVGYRQSRIPAHINTRMGASLLHNVIWMSAVLRGRDKEPEFSHIPALQAALADSAHGLSLLRSPTDPMIAPEEAADNTQSWRPSSEGVASATEFPFGAWDDTNYDNWMEYGGLDSDFDWIVLQYV
ncbi:hypothetical protein LTR78_005511, partial [Recurvomyces mirabilis]